MYKLTKRQGLWYVTFDWKLSHVVWTPWYCVHGLYWLTETDKLLLSCHKLLQAISFIVRYLVRQCLSIFGLVHFLMLALSGLPGCVPLVGLVLELHWCSAQLLSPTMVHHLWFTSQSLRHNMVYFQGYNNFSRSSVSPQHSRVMWSCLNL